LSWVLASGAENVTELRLAMKMRDQYSLSAGLPVVHDHDDAEEASETGKVSLDSSDLELVNDSGRSSWMLLQNCYPPGEVQRQGLTIALTISEALLQGRGAWRVHGGGFAGTIQAFVPDDLLPEYIKGMEAVFGHASCHAVHIRPAGASMMMADT
jgi:galactokinase